MKKIIALLCTLLLLASAILFFCLWQGERTKEPPSVVFTVNKVYLEKELNESTVAADNAEVLSYFSALAEAEGKIFVLLELDGHVNGKTMTLLTDGLSKELEISPWHGNSGSGKSDGWYAVLRAENGTFLSSDIEILAALSKHDLIKELRLSRVPIAYPDA